MDAIDGLAHQKTIILLITHRLSTVKTKNCDQIVLLEQGRIKAKESFEDLAEQNNQFTTMASRA